MPFFDSLCADDSSPEAKTGSGKKKKAIGRQPLIDDYDGSDDSMDDSFLALADVEAPSQKTKSSADSRQKEEDEGSDSPGESGDNDDGGETNDAGEDLAAAIAADHERMSRSLGTIFYADHSNHDDGSLFSEDEEIEVVFGLPTLTSSGIARRKKKTKSGCKTVCCFASRWGRLACCLVVLIVVAAAVMAPLYFLGVIQFGGSGSGEQQQQQITGGGAGQQQQQQPGLKGTASSSEGASDSPTQMKPQEETEKAEDAGGKESDNDAPDDIAPENVAGDDAKETEGGKVESQKDIEPVEEKAPVEDEVDAEDAGGAAPETSLAQEDAGDRHEKDTESVPEDTSDPTPAPSPEPTPAPTPEPTLAPTADPRPHDVKVFETLTKVSGDAVHVEGSPQNKAAKFMALTDPSGPRDISSPLFLQRYALATLYYSTAGDDWKPCLGCNPNARPFLSEAHECLWVGVMCLGTGKVVAIDFLEEDIGMSGPLPDEIRLFDSLMRLALPNNKITAIPMSISYTPIVELEVSNNEISSLPTSLYGKRSLEKLHIDRNNFEGPLPDFAAIPKLEHIQAQYNSFTGTIHPSIGEKLSKLRNLDLSFNSLTGTIPPELGRLSRLVRLDLDNNDLTGEISPDIVSMSRLITLSASNNMLTGTLPPEIGGLASYWSRNGLSRDKVIRLDNNRLSGEIPAELSDIKDLVEVSLHGPENQFVGPMPQAICDVVSLTVFSLDCSATLDCSCTAACQCLGDYTPPDADDTDEDAAFTGEENVDSGIMSVFEGISGEAIERESSPAFKAARWIALSDQLKRTEDDPRLVQRYCLATLFYSTGVHRFLNDDDECTWNGVTCDENTLMVIGINLQGQNLEGAIPAEIGYLRYLQSLDLSDNNLGGIIPASLGQTQIEEIVLSNNSLRSPFPETLYNKNSIQQIRIDRNLFTGSQPTWALMPNLTHISAFGNKFDGSLDPELGSLADLQVYLVSSNQISGAIPEEYIDLDNLEKFEVAENMLTGEIPPALFGLPRLTSLSVANNKLSGKIGRQVRNMGSEWSKEGERKRKYVQLDNNYLEGRIPDDLGEVEDLYLVTLHGNSFQGQMPEAICELEVASSGSSFALHKFTSDCDNVDCSCTEACQCV